MLKSDKQTTVETLRISFTEHLKGHYPYQEINAMFLRCAEKYLEMDNLKVHREPERLVDQDNEMCFAMVAERLIKHEPIQYILGETSFYNASIHVA